VATEVKSHNHGKKIASFQMYATEVWQKCMDIPM